MAEFSVNPKRFDPYKNFKFRIKWDGRYVAGISKISDCAARPKSFSIAKEAIRAAVANLRAAPNMNRSRSSAVLPTIRNSRTGPTKSGALVPARAQKFHLKISARTSFWSSTMKPDNSSSPTKFTAAGFRNIRYFPIWMRMRMLSLSSTSSWKMKDGNETILCLSRSSHLRRNLSRAILCRARRGVKENQSP